MDVFREKMTRLILWLGLGLVLGSFSRKKESNPWIKKNIFILEITKKIKPFIPEVHIVIRMSENSDKRVGSEKPGSEQRRNERIVLARRNHRQSGSFPIFVAFCVRVVPFFESRWIKTGTAVDSEPVEFVAVAAVRIPARLAASFCWKTVHWFGIVRLFAVGFELAQILVRPGACHVDPGSVVRSVVFDIAKIL